MGVPFLTSLFPFPTAPQIRRTELWVVVVLLCCFVVLCLFLTWHGISTITSLTPEVGPVQAILALVIDSSFLNARNTSSL